MTTIVKARMSYPFIALAIITLALGSWGLYELMTEHGGAPQWFGLLTIAGIDLLAVAFGAHALRLSEDGDSPLIWNVGLVLICLIGAVAQFESRHLAGDPNIVGIVSAIFPIGTVALFEGQLRRVYRLNGRASGRVAAPRPIIGAMSWMFFTKQALRATKLGVLDPNLNAEEAMHIEGVRIATEDRSRAEARERTEAARRPVKTPSRRFHYPELDAATAYPEIEQEAAKGGRIPAPESGPRPSVADTVRIMKPESADDPDLIRRVRLVHPDASEETIKRYARNGTR